MRGAPGVTALLRADPGAGRLREPSSRVGLAL